MSEMKPPERVYVLPGCAGCGWKWPATSQRSSGISPTASLPDCSKDQNSAGFSAPGNRHESPTTAIGEMRPGALSFPPMSGHSPGRSAVILLTPMGLQNEGSRDLAVPACGAVETFTPKIQIRIVDLRNRAASCSRKQVVPAWAP